ncbi:lipopolysaccharide biosynthesis protein [Vibrio celticus]|uniref:Teichuronic acid biosynthesis protein TuaB n=1 Tax=Vibrio celticus TaxID=446372 RepID=A0A1C3J9G4_9VIBR|nr:lipopolysaccharide biosynthesis protein [Vibrio celticus]SBT11696.1 Teichuronic acid biosynthesis protein TuaB [Vibrio celticus]
MRKLLYSAIKKSILGKFLIYAVQFSALAIYARLFSPEQFGVIASIQVFVIFFQMLSDVGIGPAIINEKSFNSNQRDGVFTVTFVLGLALGMLFYFCSYFLNSLYGGYEYQSIAMIVSVSIVFYSLSIVPIASLNKDAQFVRIAKSESIAELISLFFVYFLFLADFGVLALAAKSLLQSLFRFFLIHHQSKNTSMGRARLGREVQHIKQLASFAGYQFGFNFINYFSRNLDNVLIAKYFGMSAVGVYEKSYQLMRYPLMVTTFAMTPAIQPILTKVRNDKEKIIKEHDRLTSRLLALSLPISVFLFFNSEIVILILFGEQWLEIEPLIMIFAFMIPTQAVLSTSGSFFQVANKPRLLFFSGILSAIVNVTAIFLGVSLGEIKYVAMCLVLSFSINYFQTYFLLFRYCFNTRLRYFFVSQIKSVFIMLPSIAMYSLLDKYLLSSFEFGNFEELLINGMLGAVSIAMFFAPIKRFLNG